MGWREKLGKAAPGMIDKAQRKLNEEVAKRESKPGQGDKVKDVADQAATKLKDFLRRH